MIKKLLLVLVISQNSVTNWAMELPKASHAIGIASSVAGSYLLIKAAKAQYELFNPVLSSDDRKSLIFRRDLNFAAGASSKLCSILILPPHIAQCYNPAQTWKVVESCSAFIAAGIIFLEEAYKAHKELDRKPWRKKNRDEFLICGVMAIGFGGLLGSLVYCADEDSEIVRV